MDTSSVIALSTAFILGLQHAFEPDHVVAVSTMATRSRGILRSLVTGSVWGLGHTLTLLVAGMFLLLLKIQMPVGIGDSFELGVGFMLIVLGIWAIVNMKERKLHIHTHTHDGKTHTHIHSHAETESHNHAHIPFSVGMAHGLAGSGALVVLVMSSMSGIFQGLFFIVFFGIGLIFAMSLIASALSLPSKLGGKSSVLIRYLFSTGAGLLSIALGAFILLSFYF